MLSSAMWESHKPTVIVAVHLRFKPLSSQLITITDNREKAYFKAVWESL